MYWKVADTNVRLMGSMHFFPPEAGDVPAWVKEAYKWSQEVYLEIDPNGPPPDFAQDTPNDLVSRLPANDWQTILKLWQPNAVLPELAFAKPWAIMIMAPLMTHSRALGVENFVKQQTKIDSKKLSFLETTQSFFDGADQMPIEEIVTGLRILAADLSAPGTNLQRMHHAWAKRDFAEFEAVVKDLPFLRLGVTKRLLLDERNKQWLPTILAALNNPTPTLIVAGALHFMTEGNLLDLLRSHGKIVECA